MGLRIPEKLRVGNPVDFARLVWDEVSTVHVMVPGTKCSVKVRVCAHGPLPALPPSCSRTGKEGGTEVAARKDVSPTRQGPFPWPGSCGFGCLAVCEEVQLALPPPTAGV